MNGTEIFVIKINKDYRRFKTEILLLTKLSQIYLHESKQLYAIGCIQVNNNNSILWSIDYKTEIIACNLKNMNIKDVHYLTALIRNYENFVNININHQHDNK